MRLCTPYSIADGRKYELVRLYTVQPPYLEVVQGHAHAAARRRRRRPRARAARRGVGPPAVRCAAERGQWGKHSQGAHVSLGAEVDLRHVAGQDAFVRGQQQLYPVALRCEGKGTVAWVLLEECVCGPPVVMASVETGHLRDSITPHRLQLAIGELTDNHHDDGFATRSPGVAQLFDSEVAATTDIVGGSVSPAAGNHKARAFEQDKKASGAGPVDTGPVATNTSATFDDDTKTSQPEKETGASFVLHEAGAFEHGDALSGNSVDTADVRCAPCKIACSAGVDQMQGTWNNLQPMYKLLWLMGVLALAVLGFTVLI
eukprot:COSAG01_NODE_13273_length_1608_cov_584.326706_1_plen_315_part_10